MRTIDDVQSFLEDFFKKELQLHTDRNNLVGSREEYIDRVYDFFDDSVLFSAEHSFSNLTAWPYNDSEEERMGYIKNMLRLRKLFVIEEYKNAKLEVAIKNEGFSDTLFVMRVTITNHQIIDTLNAYMYQKQMNN
ncbi:hypothetical protein BKI52_27355 [marine bacterium AO1-C]|nr:hypothetical protein BKI52_27355 [marine bacterium AO1-C]